MDCALDFAEDRLSAPLGLGAFRSDESVSQTFLRAWCLVVPLWNTVDFELGSQSRDNFHLRDRSPCSCSHINHSNLPATSLPELAYSTVDSLASKFEISVRHSVQAGFSVLLGGEQDDLYTGLFYTSPVFLITTFSMQERRSVVEDDLV